MIDYNTGKIPEVDLVLYQYSNPLIASIEVRHFYIPATSSAPILVDVRSYFVDVAIVLPKCVFGLPTSSTNNNQPTILQLHHYFFYSFKSYSHWTK